jgi:hypothetical protein
LQGRCEAWGEHQEVFVSVLTRKQPITASGKFRELGPKAQVAALQAAQQAQVTAQQAAAQAQAAAQQAAPFARTATDGAVAWATPRVDAARAWAAPQLEMSARAISDSLAPMISGALMNAARKVDAPVRKRPRRRGGLFAGIALLIAAVAAGAVAAMRLREGPEEFTSVPMTDDGGPPPDPDMNGHSQIV